MSTEYKMKGQVVAVRYYGGKQRGTIVQMEVTEAQWDADDKSECVVDEYGETWPPEVWMEEMKATKATVVWMSKWVMNARANDMKQVADRWAKAGHDGVAYEAAKMAQQMKAWRE